MISRQSPELTDRPRSDYDRLPAGHSRDCYRAGHLVGSGVLDAVELAVLSRHLGWSNSRIEATDLRNLSPDQLAACQIELEALLLIPVGSRDYFRALADKSQIALLADFGHLTAEQIGPLQTRSRQLADQGLLVDNDQPILRLYTGLEPEAVAGSDLIRPAVMITDVRWPQLLNLVNQEPGSQSYYQALTDYIRIQLLLGQPVAATVRDRARSLTETAWLTNLALKIISDSCDLKQSVPEPAGVLDRGLVKRVLNHIAPLLAWPVDSDRYQTLIQLLTWRLSNLGSKSDLDRFRQSRARQFLNYGYLKDRESQMVLYRYGLFDGRCWTLDEIASKFDLSLRHTANVLATINRLIMSPVDSPDFVRLLTKLAKKPGLA